MTIRASGPEGLLRDLSGPDQRGSTSSLTKYSNMQVGRYNLGRRRHWPGHVRESKTLKWGQCLNLRISDPQITPMSWVLKRFRGCHRLLKIQPTLRLCLLRASSDCTLGNVDIKLEIALSSVAFVIQSGCTILSCRAWGFPRYLAALFNKSPGHDRPLPKTWVNKIRTQMMTSLDRRVDVGSKRCGLVLVLSARCLLMRGLCYEMSCRRNKGAIPAKSLMTSSWLGGGVRFSVFQQSMNRPWKAIHRRMPTVRAVYGPAPLLITSPAYPESGKCTFLLQLRLISEFGTL